MMKKSILLLITILMYVLSATSKNVSEMFLEMPDTMLPYISYDQRVDLVNMKRIDMQTPATVKSVFRSDVSLTMLEDDRLTVGDSLFQYSLIRLMGTEGDSLFCVLCTITSIHTTTTCHIYDSNWNLVKKIDLDDMISHFSNYTEEEAEKLKQIEFPIIEVAIDSDVSILYITVSDPLPYSDEKDKSNVVLQRNVKWDGKSFKET